jgi:hypothetical protein
MPESSGPEVFTEEPDHPSYRDAYTWASVALQDTIDAKRMCALGLHAWTPWFQLPNTSFVTICGREGCAAERQYDL